MGARQCLLFLAFPSVYNHSASFFPNNNSKGREPSLPFIRLLLILQKRPSDAWPGTHLGPASYRIKSRVGLKGPYTGLLPVLCPGAVFLASSTLYWLSLQCSGGHQPAHPPGEHMRERDLIPAGEAKCTKLPWGLHRKTAAMMVSNLSALSCFSHNGLCVT